MKNIKLFVLITGVFISVFLISVTFIKQLLLIYYKRAKNVTHKRQ